MIRGGPLQIQVRPAREAVFLKTREIGVIGREEFFRGVGLELDGVRAALGRGRNQPGRQSGIAVVIQSALRDKETGGFSANGPPADLDFAHRILPADGRNWSAGVIVR